MVKVCDHCSNIDIEVLKSIVPKEKLEFGCTGHCDVYKGKTYGYVAEEFIVSDTQEDFIDHIKQWY